MCRFKSLPRSPFSSSLPLVAGIPYTAAMVGCKLVLPGSALDGASLYELMKEEGVRDKEGGRARGKGGVRR